MSEREIVEAALRENGLPVEPLSDADVRHALFRYPDQTSSLLHFVHKRKGSLPVVVTEIGVSGFCYGVPQ